MVSQSRITNMLGHYRFESKGYAINFGSNGMSGSVLQYLTRQTKSTRRSGPPAPAPADEDELELCWPGRRRSTAGAAPACGGLTVGGISLLSTCLNPKTMSIKMLLFNSHMHLNDILQKEFDRWYLAV